MQWIIVGNLHTIIQFPNSTFKPYASIATNILFFTKGAQTTETWYYQHRVPEGQKHYSKTKPIKSEHLDPIREWWDNREESEYSWKVTVQEIVDANYGIYNWKNPNIPEEETETTEVLLEKYWVQTEEVNSIMSNIIKVLREALGMNN